MQCVGKTSQTVPMISRYIVLGVFTYQLNAFFRKHVWSDNESIIENFIIQFGSVFIAERVGVSGCLNYCQ